MPLSTVLGAQSLIKPGVCTTATRPASPFEGQMIYDTTTDTQLVWNGTAWVTIGPPTAPTTAFVSGQQSTTSTSYVALTTATAVTVTTGTSALVVASARLINTSTNYEAIMSYAVSGATTVAASDNYLATFAESDTAASAGCTGTLFYVHTGLTAGSNTFSLQFRVAVGGTGYFASRRITVFPL